MQIKERERENKYFGRILHSFWMLSISDDTHLQCKGEKQWIAVQAGISTLWFNIGWLPRNLDVPLRIKKNKQKKLIYIPSYKQEEEFNDFEMSLQLSLQIYTQRLLY